LTKFSDEKGGGRFRAPEPPSGSANEVASELLQINALDKFIGRTVGCRAIVSGKINLTFILTSLQ
jgi:hypothetical protein